MKKEKDIEEKEIEILRIIRSQIDIIIKLLAIRLLDPEEVKKTIVKGTPDKERIIKCYNSCDGETMLTDIAKNCKIDPGAFSRRVDSWEKEGFLVKIEKGGKVFPKALIYLK